MQDFDTFLSLQARLLQRCFSHNRSCQEHEILRNELQQQQQQQDENNNSDSSKRHLRLLVVPEAVEGTDASDGATEWDKEFTDKFQKERNNNLV